MGTADAPPPRRRRLAKRIALAVAILAAGAAGTEMLARAWLARLPLMGVAEPDAELGWSVPPFAKGEADGPPGAPRYPYTTNSLGLRASPDPSECAPDDFCVLVQGDSQAWGFGLRDDETVAARLNEALRASPPPGVAPERVRCINAGVPGYDLQHYETQARRLMAKYPVDVRVLLINVGNDYSCALLRTPYFYPRPARDLGPAGGLVDVPAPAPIRAQMYAHAFVPSLAGISDFDADLEWINRTQGILDADRPGRSATIVSVQYILRRRRFGSRPSFLPRWTPYQGNWMFRRPLDPLLIDLYGLGSKLLQGLPVQAPTLAVLVPMRPEVDPAERAAILAETEQLGRMSDNAYGCSFDYPSDLVARICVDAGVPYADPRAAYRSQPDPASLFLPNDPHLSAAGADLVAREIARRLAE